MMGDGDSDGDGESRCGGRLDLVGGGMYIYIYKIR